eukprot:6153704-Alexandrium_andersonii.AAC.1
MASPCPSRRATSTRGSSGPTSLKRSRNDGGVGLAFDTSRWFNLGDFSAAFSAWRGNRGRPLGTGRKITREDFVAMIAMRQGDEVRGGK